MKCQIAVVVMLVVGCVSAMSPWFNAKLTNSWSPNIKDVAKAINCGDAKHNFTLMWTPTKLQHGKDILFYFNMVAAEEFSTGNMELTVKIQNTPIIKKIGSFDCHHVKGIAKSFPLFRFPCPFHKGERFKVKGMRVPFNLPIALPAGKYEVDVKITFPNGRLFLCAQLNLHLLETKFDDDDY